MRLQRHFIRTESFSDRLVLELFDQHLEDKIVLADGPEDARADLRDERGADLPHKLLQFFLAGLSVVGVLDEDQGLVPKAERETEVVHSSVSQVHFLLELGGFSGQILR